MPLDLKQLLDPAHTAVLVMECQEGVIGGGGRLGALGEAVARHGTVARIRRLLDAARGAGVRVFYLNAARRPDSAGASANCLLLALGRKSEPLVPGSPRQAVVADLAPHDSDFVINRFHGVTPFHGTELDSLLRNLGVKTVVASGVSVNVGITGLVIEAVNCGYQVVLPRDAVAGTPDDYVDAVFANTLRLLATVTAVDDVAEAWASAGRRG
jgi:nicotinamidase-related amidase